MAAYEHSSRCATRTTLTSMPVNSCRCLVTDPSLSSITCMPAANVTSVTSGIPAGTVAANRHSSGWVVVYAHAEDLLDSTFHGGDKHLNSCECCVASCSEPCIQVQGLGASN
jgi:hypothetical protein